MISYERIASLVGHSNATIFEIGANGGQDTKKLIDPFKYGHLFAFEPDPRAASRFRKTVDDPRVHLFEIAIGATVGTIEFYQSSGSVPMADEDRVSRNLPEDWDLSGSIRKPKLHRDIHPWCKFETKIEVQVTTLDEWTSSAGIGHIDFIWADVQGAEADLISGGRSALSRTRWFYTEFSNEELYEGEIGLERIASLLPEFSINELFENDVLFENKKLSAVYK